MRLSPMVLSGERADGNGAADRAEARARVDQEIGRRIRARRVFLGMTQEGLGASVDVTFQQIQKYESGANRIGASRLHELSAILGVPITFFFDAKPKLIGPEPAQGAGSPQAARLPEREVIELVRAFGGVADPRTRKAITALIQSISGSKEYTYDAGYDAGA